MISGTHVHVDIAVALGLAVLCSGCLLAGNYHSAKTLAKGESSFGLNFSATTYEFTSNDDTDRVTLPALLPELTFHVGLQDNLEIGGRVGFVQLALEADLKYRLVRSPRFHLAVAPAISGQSLILISGTSVKLPLIATYELADNIAITGSIFGSTTRYGAVDPDDADEDLARFSGNLGATGGSFFFEFSGETFAIRPGVEFTRYSIDFDDEDDFEEFNTMSIMVHLSWIRGREKQQLDRIENKLDRMQGYPQQY
ncbi:MAG: hypothetical protein MJE77_39440 [Proteobacteria bacterium]|nr:hypothetical protein [Pseudomonadota bacterium]